MLVHVPDAGRARTAVHTFSVAMVTGDWNYVDDNFV